MDFHQLEVFVKTVEHQSFSVAAEILFLSQPTVSTQIRALEQELHTELIRRTTKSFSITPDGQRLYAYACSLLELRRKAVRELDGTQRRELSIGASSIPGLRFLPRVLTLFHRQFPNIQLRTTSGDSLNIIQQVESGLLDVGLVGTRMENHCTFVPFAKDELVLVTPRTPHYEARQSEPPLALLQSEPFILRAETSGTEQFIRKLLEAHQLQPESLHVVCSMDNASVLLNCVAQGLGISIVSRRMIESFQQRERLLVFPLEHPAAVRELYLTYPKSKFLSQPVEQFLRLCLDCSSWADAGDASELSAELHKRIR